LIAFCGTKVLTTIYADFEAGFMSTPRELRQARIFACLDEAECARLAHTTADVRLEPGEWLFREGAPAWFYVLLEGRLRIILDVHGNQTGFAEYEFKRGDFFGEVPSSDGLHPEALPQFTNVISLPIGIGRYLESFLPPPQGSRRHAEWVGAADRSLP
jgi:hypothetical protein